MEKRLHFMTKPISQQPTATPSTIVLVDLLQALEITKMPMMCKSSPTIHVIHLLQQLNLSKYLKGLVQKYFLTQRSLVQSRS